MSPLPPSHEVARQLTANPAMAQALCECLEASSIAGLKDRLKQSILLAAPQLRREDIDAEVAAVWPTGQSLPGLTFMTALVGGLLEATSSGLGWQVRANCTVPWLNFIRPVHPGPVLAATAIQQDDAWLVQWAAEQSELALPVPDQPYADNHVHLNGVAQSNSFLALVAAGRVPDRGWKHFPAALDARLPPEWSLPALASLTRHASTLILEVERNGVSAGKLALQRLVAEIRRIKSGAEEVQDDMTFKPAELDGHEADFGLLGQWALAHNEGHFARAFLLLCAIACRRYVAQGTSWQVQAAVLLLFQMFSCIRGGISMSGSAGLSYFMQYFSRIRTFDRDVSWRMLLGSDHSHAAIRFGGKRLSKMLNHVAEHSGQLPYSAIHPWQRLHCIYHFSRSMKEKAVNSPSLRAKAIVDRQHDDRTSDFKRQLRRLAQGAHESGVSGHQLTHRLGTLLRGFDVAGNENHLPIEAFAPLLRSLRPPDDKGTTPDETRRFLTIHVGEDFPCLVSGLRAVAEAMTFCALGRGDRLGHALALGMDPLTWARRRRYAFLPLDVHLDNLVWLWGMAEALLGRGLPQAAAAVVGPAKNRVHERIEFYRRTVYTMETSAARLWAAWKLRDMAADEAGSRENDGWEEFQYRRAGFAADTGTIRVNYFGSGEFTLGQDQFDMGMLTLVEILQDYLMSECGKKGIAIEACPSSNTTVQSLEMDAHPIYRWVPPDQIPGTLRINRFSMALHPVTVMVNTDDPGIFPTSIVAEHRLLVQAAEETGTAAGVAAAWGARLRQAGMQVFSDQQARVVLEPRL